MLQSRAAALAAMAVVATACTESPVSVPARAESPAGASATRVPAPLYNEQQNTQPAPLREEITQRTFAPIYMRYFWFGPEHGDWIPLIFYRDPSCIRPSADLLTGFDPPWALNCPIDIAGFQLREQPGWVPYQTVIEAHPAVPIWFVARAAWDLAAADGKITIGELNALPAASLLRGSAPDYHEVHHYNPQGRPGGAVVPKADVVASGSLADGREFRLHVSLQNHGQGTEYRVADVRF